MRTELNKKFVKLNTNLWYIMTMDKFLARMVDNKDNTTAWAMFGKYTNKQLKDFCLKTSRIQDMVRAIEIFSEDIPTPIAEDFQVETER